MIIGHIGRMGSGKTLTMTKNAYKYYLAGYRIYSNIKLNFPHYPYTLQDLIDWANNDFNLQKSIIIIDECHIFLDSRQAGSKKNRLISYVLLQSRKKACHIWYTTQRFHQVDKRLRENSDVIIECKTKTDKYGDKYTFNKINILLENSIKLKSDIFKSSDYYNLYNTYEVVRSI